MGLADAAVLPASAATMPSAVPTQAVPGATVAAPAPAAAAQAAPGARLGNDVLALELDGHTITRAELLRYPQAREAGSQPVVLMTTDPARQFTARSRWLRTSASVASSSTHALPVPRSGAAARSISARRTRPRGARSG